MKVGLNGLHMTQISGFVEIYIPCQFFELAMDVWIVAYCYLVFFVYEFCLLFVDKLPNHSSVGMDQ